MEIEKTRLAQKLAIYIRTTEEDEENEVMKIRLSRRQADKLAKQGYKVFRTETNINGGMFTFYHTFVRTDDLLKIVPKI